MSLSPTAEIAQIGQVDREYVAGGRGGGGGGTRGREEWMLPQAFAQLRVA